MAFRILHKDKKTKARVGILSTKSGDIETPFFMPVGTKTTVKNISSEALESMKANAIICNSFILALRPGINIIKKAGGISKFMRYHGIVFTDSGGFQMYSPALYLESRENGVVFRDPFQGDKIFMTPEESMKIQLTLGADVAMCLDSMPLLHQSKESIAEAVRKTGEWAKKCKAAHDKMQSGIKEEKRQMLFGITQGGIHKDLRKKSCLQISEINFDGFALGGLALGETKEQEYEMIDLAVKILPEEKPRYLMGAGNPIELLEAISRGIDMFDSRFPTKNARRGTLFTSKGKMMITNARYKDDFSLLDEGCECFVCKKYTKAYIRHLLMHEEGTGFQLASYHNLFFLQNLMEKAREEIKRGKFDNFLKKFKKDYKNNNKLK